MFVQKPLYAEVCFHGLDSKEWVCQVNYYTQNTFYFNRCHQINFLKDPINSSFYQQTIKIAFSLSLLPAKDHCYPFFLFQEGQGLRRQSYRYKVKIYCYLNLHYSSINYEHLFIYCETFGFASSYLALVFLYCCCSLFVNILVISCKRYPFVLSLQCKYFYQIHCSYAIFSHPKLFHKSKYSLLSLYFIDL